MNYTGVEEMIERILSYYKELIEETDVKDTGLKNYDYYKFTSRDIVERLLPFAKDGNYWWEERSIKMAYYQMKIDILVVPFKDYCEYYKKLMGKEYDYKEMCCVSYREVLLKEADEKYKKLTKSR